MRETLATRSRCRFIACTVAALWIGLGSPAVAGERGCSAAAPALAAFDAQVRLGFIADRLRGDARRARVWAWSWAGVHSALVGYHVLEATALDPTRDGRVDGWVGAATSGLALVLLVAHPLPVMRDQRWLDGNFLHTLPYSDGDLERRCALLAEAEQRLVRDAAAERLGRSALAHVVNFVFNIGVGVLLGAGFGRWEQAALAMLGGTAVAELQTLTQSTGAIDALDDYRAGRLGPALPRRDRLVRLVPAVGVRGGGLTLSLAF